MKRTFPTQKQLQDRNVGTLEIKPGDLLLHAQVIEVRFPGYPHSMTHYDEFGLNFEKIRVVKDPSDVMYIVVESGWIDNDVVKGKYDPEREFWWSQHPYIENPKIFLFWIIPKSKMPIKVP